VSFRKPTVAEGLGAWGAGVRSEAEVRERALTVPVDVEPSDLAAAEVEHGRSLGPHLPYLKAARLAAPAEAIEHKDPLSVELAVPSA
jgi:hypothetical protein